MQEMADILKISKSIKLLVKMKKMYYLTEKTRMDFWPTEYILAMHK